MLNATQLNQRLARLLTCAILAMLWASGAPGGGTGRVDLFPKLRAGQTLRYQINYRSDKQTRTQSSVVMAEAPAAAKIDAHGVLQVEILGVAMMGTRAVIHARTTFESFDSGDKVSAGSQPLNPLPGAQPGESSVEFTILPDGRLDHVNGLDALSPEQQQTWREWAARFAAAAIFPANGVSLAQRWKSEQSEGAPSPIAALTWVRESTYVRDEPCRPLQITSEGEAIESETPPEICAVILTTAALKQQSPPKDTTPEDFRLNQLRTSGTARGANKTITYISLRTGLVVRSSDEADQSMAVTIAKADGTNRVHYDIRAHSNAEVALLTAAPQDHS